MRTRRARPASPWAAGALEQIVAADIFGTGAMPMTRAEAMTVPALANARWLIAPVLGRHPLAAYRGEEQIDTPAWLYRTNGVTAPQMRMTWTIDDLLFTGYSLWRVERGAKGTILAGDRVPLESWDFDEEWRVLIDDELAAADEVILFTSPMDPLLECAARTIRAARNIEEAWAARVKDPIPVMELRQTEDIELDEEPLLDGDDEEVEPSEAQAIIDAYVKARKAPTGAVVHTPYGYELVPHGQDTPELYISGRNAVAIDVARFTGLPASLLSASPVQSSLTYSTQVSSRSDYQDYSLAPWAMAIESRLSMDDVVPAGVSIKFDLTHLNTVPTPTTGPVVED